MRGFILLVALLLDPAAVLLLLAAARRDAVRLPDTSPRPEKRTSEARTKLAGHSADEVLTKGDWVLAGLDYHGRK